MLRGMRTPLFFGSCALLAVGVGLALGSLTSSCADINTSTGSTSGGTGGAGGAAPAQVMPIPGELCQDPTRNPSQITARVTPSKVFLPACPTGSTSCTTRTVKLTVDPDTCIHSSVSFASDKAGVAPAPADTSVDLHNDSVPVTITAGPTTGTATITATVLVQPTPDNVKAGVKPAPVTTTFTVEVLDPTPPTPCTAMAVTAAV